MERRGKRTRGCCPELVCPERNAAHEDRRRVVEDLLYRGDGLWKEVLLREQRDSLVAECTPSVHRGDGRNSGYEEECGDLHCCGRSPESGGPVLMDGTGEQAAELRLDLRGVGGG